MEGLSLFGLNEIGEHGMNLLERVRVFFGLNEIGEYGINSLGWDEIGWNGRVKWNLYYELRWNWEEYSEICNIKFGVIRENV